MQVLWYSLDWIMFFSYYSENKSLSVSEISTGSSSLWSQGLCCQAGPSSRTDLLWVKIRGHVLTYCSFFFFLYIDNIEKENGKCSYFWLKQCLNIPHLMFFHYYKEKLISRHTTYDLKIFRNKIHKNTLFNRKQAHGWDFALIFFMYTRPHKL